ncbi:hypothetical protein E2C01_096038 [Portunus trituberculatus]|uniref:Uncharacterized protein n=1 Tax=Portunus trituberculatus TaxID=210409 RepID=A0A5B7K5K3_PORTR|nr:hypothetical protein [Portunus trituberculatus]
MPTEHTLTRRMSCSGVTLAVRRHRRRRGGVRAAGGMTAAYPSVATLCLQAFPWPTPRFGFGDRLHQ